MNIRFSHWWPGGSPFEQGVFLPILEEIKEKTNGRIDYTFYPGASLCKAEDTHDAVARGISDMSYLTLGFEPGRYPLSDVFSLPLTYPDNKTKVDVALPVFDKMIYEELPDVHAFCVFGTADFYYMGNVEARTLEDMKGLKIRTPGHLMTKAIEALGATPIFMAPPDIYLSLETGVIDGQVNAPITTHIFKLNEVISWTTKFNLGAVVVGFIMNKDFWEKIPDDLKPIVEEAGRKGAYHNAATNDNTYDMYMAEIAEAGPVYTLPPSEEDRWNAALKTMVKEWVAELEAKGLPAEDVVDLYKEECIKKGIHWPF